MVQKLASLEIKECQAMKNLYVQGMVIGITKPHPKEGARNALLHNCLNQTQTDY